jgi:hypothetical protein
MRRSVGEQGTTFGQKVHGVLAGDDGRLFCLRREMLNDGFSGVLAPGPPYFVEVRMEQLLQTFPRAPHTWMVQLGFECLKFAQNLLHENLTIGQP